MQSADFSSGKGRTRVKFRLERDGRDYVGILTGGAAHVGAGALAWRDQSGAVRARTIVRPGHREGGVARFMAVAVCDGSGRSCLVVAGIHLDRIRRSEIETILRNVRDLARQVRAAFGSWQGD
jgi:DNA-binding IclR family transcriptional regulator